MRKVIENLRTKPEDYRRKVALFAAAAVSLTIFVSWAGFKGFIEVPKGEVVYEESEGNAAAVESSEASSPFDNSMSALKAAWSQFDEGYASFKESLSNVLVPFISGIEVYESK